MPDGNAAGELLQRGIRHHGAGEIVEARNIYVEILEREPQNHRVLDLAGLLCMQCDELEAAADFFDSAIALDPASGRYLCHAGTLQLRMGKLDRAAPLLHEAIAADPQISEAFLSLALVHRARAEHDDAVAVLEDGLSHAPENSRLLAWRGILEIDRHDLPGAAEFLHKAVSLDNGNLEAMAALGNVMLELGELPIAERCYLSVKERAPEDLGTRCRLLVLLKRQQRSAEAAAECEDILNMAARLNGAAILGDIALLLEELDNPEDGLLAAERALALDGGDAERRALLERLRDKAAKAAEKSG